LWGWRRWWRWWRRRWYNATCVCKLDVDNISYQTDSKSNTDNGKNANNEIVAIKYIKND